MNLEVNKSYHILHGGELRKAYIMYILDGHYEGQKLIVFRYYGKYKQWWHHDISGEEIFIHEIELAKKKKEMQQLEKQFQKLSDIESYYNNNNPSLNMDEVNDLISYAKEAYENLSIPYPGDFSIKGGLITTCLINECSLKDGIKIEKERLNKLVWNQKGYE